MHFHLLGIGGIGMSAIAQCLHQQGHSVSGSDTQDGDATRILAALGIPISFDQDLTFITDETTVVYSAILEGRDERLDLLRKRGLKVYKRSDFLPILLQDRTIISVIGSHGKTTTTAMLGWILEQAGLDPMILVGGIMNQHQSNFRWGRGPVVIESDEFDKTLLKLKPTYNLLLNIGSDHLEQYNEDMQELRQAFQTSVNQTSGLCFANRDCSEIALLNLPPSTVFFGESSTSDWHLESAMVIPDGTRMAVSFQNQTMSFTLPLWGTHNAMNALAAWSVAHHLGILPADVIQALERFPGIKRRTTFLGQIHGVSFWDDYAHNEDKVRAVIKAMKQAHMACVESNTSPTQLECDEPPSFLQQDANATSLEPMHLSSIADNLSPKFVANPLESPTSSLSPHILRTDPQCSDPSLISPCRSDSENKSLICGSESDLENSFQASDPYQIGSHFSCSIHSIGSNTLDVQSPGGFDTTEKNACNRFPFVKMPHVHEPLSSKEHDVLDAIDVDDLNPPANHTDQHDSRFRTEHRISPITSSDPGKSLLSQTQQKLWVLFEPHRYSRVKRNPQGYADALKAADEVMLLPVYPAGEIPDSAGFSERIAECLLRIQLYTHLQEVEAFLFPKLQPGDWVLALSAGPLTYALKDFMKNYQYWTSGNMLKAS